MNELYKNIQNHSPVQAITRIKIEDTPDNRAVIQALLFADPPIPGLNLKVRVGNNLPTSLAPGFVSDAFIEIASVFTDPSLLLPLDENKKTCPIAAFFSRIAPIVEPHSYAMYTSKAGAIHRFDFIHKRLRYSFHKGGSFISSFASIDHSSSDYKVISSLNSGKYVNILGQFEPEEETNRSENTEKKSKEQPPTENAKSGPFDESPTREDLLPDEAYDIFGYQQALRSDPKAHPKAHWSCSVNKNKKAISAYFQAKEALDKAEKEVFFCLQQEIN